MNKESLDLIFTSFRDAQELSGLRVSIDRHIPKQCPYPTLSFLTIPLSKTLSPKSIEQICQIYLENNWNQVKGFLDNMYGLGIRQIVLCDWATKSQIEAGKLCVAGIIGRYIKYKAENGVFDYPITILYDDGRDKL